MATYYAIAHRSGRWIFICSGSHPEELYREAINIIEAQERYFDDEGGVLSIGAESQLNTLRVVPEETARDHYHVTFPRWAHVEE